MGAWGLGSSGLTERPWGCSGGCGAGAELSPAPPTRDAPRLHRSHWAECRAGMVQGKHLVH